MPADPIGFHDVPASRLRLWADMGRISSARYVEEMERREKAAAGSSPPVLLPDALAVDTPLDSLLPDLQSNPCSDPLPFEARSMFAFHEALVAILEVFSFVLLAYLAFAVIPSITMVAITGERP